jgi:hypothetical protein
MSPGFEGGFLSRQPKQDVEDTFTVRHHRPTGEIVIDPLTGQTQNPGKIALGTSLGQMGLNPLDQGIPQGRIRSRFPRVSDPFPPGKLPIGSDSLCVVDGRLGQHSDEVGVERESGR